MTALELFTWFLYTLTAATIAIVTVITTILNDVPWTIPAVIIACNILTGVSTYYIGREAPNFTVFKQTWEATIHNEGESRPTTLDHVVRIAEPVQGVINISLELGELANSWMAEHKDNGGKDDIARVQHVITFPATEHLRSKDHRIILRQALLY